MEEESKQAKEKFNKIHRIIRYAVAIAASISLLIIIIEGCKFYALSPEKLYAENYRAYELRTASEGTDSAESKLEQAYREKKYGGVINLSKNSVLSIKDIFITGMSFLETNDDSRAISSFQVVIADVKDNKTLKDTAEYYLALAYLRNRDYDQAIELMNAIHENPSHRYKDKFSRRFIKRVKRLKWR